MNPVRSLADTAIAFLEVVEAEGRTAREKTMRLVIAIGLAIVALILACWGVVLLMTAFHHALLAIMPAGWAFFVQALVVLLIAGGALWQAVRFIR